MDATVLMATHETRVSQSGAHVPLPLVDILGEVYLTTLTRRLARVPDLKRIHIVTNDLLLNPLEEWKESCRVSDIPIAITSDGTRAPAERKGAIHDLRLLIDKHNIRDDIIVIGGHSWFTYDLARFVRKAEQRAPAVLVTTVEGGSRPSSVGWCKLNDDDQIVEFSEHPQASPETNVKASCVYYFRVEDQELLKTFSRDATARTTPGEFVQWLSTRVPTYGIHECSYWDPESSQTSGSFYGTDYLGWRDIIRVVASPQYSTWERSAASSLEHVSSHKELIGALRKTDDTNVRIVAARLLGYAKPLLSDKAVEEVIAALVAALADSGQNVIGDGWGIDEDSAYYVAATAAESLKTLGYATSVDAVFDKAHRANARIVTGQMRKNVH